MEIPYQPARPTTPSTPAINAPVAPKPAAVPSYAAVRLRYLQRARILVQGPVTGRHYEFSGESPELAVDARDAALLERSGFFQRVG
jgi:hypothetical protein